MVSKLKGKSIQIEEKNYKLIEHLKDGGNGTVWKAKCNNQNFAIKFLRKENKEKKQRFLNEIEFCKNNSHKNIIKVFDSGEYKGELFYVMPLYNVTLRDIIKSKTDNSQNFDFILQICEGLKFIHNNGVIHRDIKPENILVKEEQLVLADLGIAHFENADLTCKNDLLANRIYVAPEQKKKGLAKEVSKAADIYALGCIINELFTKENLSGTNFIEIADKYPWLHGLDGLVEQCIRQNPAERPGIEEVILEIKLFKAENDELLKDISLSLEEDYKIVKKNCPVDLNRILKCASEDILMAKYLYENTNNEKLREYNRNYNCHIHYKVDDILRRKYFNKLLYQKCELKFNYESNVYKNGAQYKPLDLSFESDNELYNQFITKMKQYGYADGKILKLFASCCDYHCEEIIKSVSDIKKEVDDLEDAPILYIVMKLKEVFHNGIIDTNEMKIEDHILINWELTANDSSAGIDKALKSNVVNKKEIEILNRFKEKYNIIYKKSSERYCIIFQEESSYYRFKEYSLSFSKQDYILEGDVLDLVKVQRSYDGIVELKPIGSYEITNVLAKILGMRKN